MTAKTKRLIVKAEHDYPSGWGCGYVAVPPEHPLHGIVYTDTRFPNIIVHGGVTFTEPCVYGDRTATSGREIVPRMVGKRCWQLRNGELLDGEIPVDWWLIGFDTCHAGDNANNWPRERVVDEVTELQRKLEQMFNLKKSTENGE